MQPASSFIRRSIWGSGCVVMICRRLIPVSPKVTAQGTSQKNDLDLLAHRVLPLQLRVGSGINFSFDRNGGWSGLHRARS